MLFMLFTFTGDSELEMKFPIDYNEVKHDCQTVNLITNDQHPYGYELYKEESDDFGLINDQCVHLIGLFATLEEGNQGRVKRTPKRRIPGHLLRHRGGLKQLKKVAKAVPKALEYGKLAWEGAKTIGNVQLKKNWREWFRSLRSLNHNKSKS